MNQLDFTEQIVIPNPFRGKWCDHLMFPNLNEYSKEAACVYCRRHAGRRQSFHCEREQYIYGRQHSADENPGIWGIESHYRPDSTQRAGSIK